MQFELKKEGLGISRPSWDLYDIPGCATLEEAAYAAVREAHPFLTDENHTWDAGPRITKWGGQLHSWTSVTIRYGKGGGKRNRLTPNWWLTSEGDFWFGVTYRAPGDVGAETSEPIGPALQAGA